MGVSPRGLFGFLARLRPPAAGASTDADLLDRFVRTADPTAFTELVRRHGPMVLAVCHRRLGHDADAEDAFQAVFLALAMSAASIRRPDALPGWLYRAAYQVALKAAGRRARQPIAPLQTTEVPMPEQPPPDWETAGLKAAVDAEVAALPDRFRSVVVLCLLEGRTSAEAAALLGIPVGTVDSRLHTARATLRTRLARRGVTAAAGVTLEQLLGGPVAAAGPRFLELASHTVAAVLAEAAGPGAGAVTPAVVELARGVNRMTTNLRVLMVTGAAFGLLGSAGAGLYFAAAADPVKPGVRATEPKSPPAGAEPKPAEPKAANDHPVEADAPPSAGNTGAAALLKPTGPGLEAEGTPLEDIFKRIEEQSGLVVRVDVAAFRRIGAVGPDNGRQFQAFVDTIYKTSAVLPRRYEKLPLRDVLTDALAQVGTAGGDTAAPLLTYQVRGGQVVIIPSYLPPFRPGVDHLNPGQEEEALLTARVVQEQIYGGVVSLPAEEKPLTEILAELRKQTGANIVLDPRCEAREKKATLSLSLNDVRLYDALRVIADMAELKMVYAGNIYYITTPANAKTFPPPPPRTPAPAGPAPKA